MPEVLPNRSQCRVRVHVGVVGLRMVGECRVELLETQGLYRATHDFGCIVASSRVHLKGERVDAIQGLYQSSRPVAVLVVAKLRESPGTG